MDTHDINPEEADRQEFQRRLPDYIALHQSIDSSTTLLDSLASFLSTFQHDLSNVSGQIFELQTHSRDIDERSKGRKSIAKPLNDLIQQLILSPTLITTIRDTRPGDAWLPLMVELEEKIHAVRVMGRVKAAHEVGMVVEGLKAKAITSLRQFLLTMLKPIRATVKTQIHIIQSSILLKYLPFYHFLRRQAPRVADEVKRAYVVGARAYYETSFRRYARALGVIAARGKEYAVPIGQPSSAELAALALLNRAQVVNGDVGKGANRLKYAKIGEGDVVPGYQEDDKEYKQPVEALFRSLCLVLLDNASAEYTFLVRFFSPLPETSSVTSSPHAGAISLSTTDLPVHRSHADSPASKFDRRESTYSLASSPIAPSTVEGSPIIYAPSPLRPSDSVSDAGDDEPPRIISRTRSTGVAGSPIGSRPATTTRSVRQSFRGESVVASPASLVGSGAGRGEMSRDVRKEVDGIWHQVFDTALEYCDAFFKSVTEPIAPPPTIPLLTMIRLNDAILAEIDDRGCTPLEPTMLRLKLGMWPLFQKQMDSHVESVKRMADAAGGGGLGAMLGRAGVKDSAVKEVAMRYAHLVSNIVALSEETEEAMLANSMTRLRTELIRLITQQSTKLKNVQERESFISTMFEDIIRELSSGPGNTAHARLQAELGFFRASEEEAQRRMRL
ncbi:Vacuolar protein sorting-associated protein 52 [Naganishia albida]|nr:Vacuolar protein sorting-associated protein 52 [Naganishia albida]